MNEFRVHDANAELEVYNVFVWNKHTAKRVWEHRDLQVTSLSSPSRNNIEKWALICAEIKPDEIEAYYVQVEPVVCWNY